MMIQIPPIDYRDVIHFMFGVLAVLLGREMVFTLIFMFYQMFERFESDRAKLGDVIEYTIGLLTGIFIKHFLGVSIC